MSEHAPYIAKADRSFVYEQGVSNLARSNVARILQNGTFIAFLSLQPSNPYIHSLPANIPTNQTASKYYNLEFSKINKGKNYDDEADQHYEELLSKQEDLGNEFAQSINKNMSKLYSSF